VDGSGIVTNTKYLVKSSEISFPNSVSFREQVAVADQSRYMLCIFPIRFDSLPSDQQGSRGRLLRLRDLSLGCMGGSL